VRCFEEIVVWAQRKILGLSQQCSHTFAVILGVLVFGTTIIIAFWELTATQPAIKVNCPSDENLTAETSRVHLILRILTMVLTYLVSNTTYVCNILV